MRVDRFSMKWIIALVSLLATAIFIAGCGGGGGGGGGGGSTPTPNYSYSGTVVDESNTALPGYTVSFDSNGSYSAVTSSTGGFKITVPSSLLMGTDTLNITDVSGTQVATYPIPAGSKGFANVTIKIGPPPPPSGLARPKTGK